MGSRIRYAWGHSPHGDFLVAAAGSDLVAFEFPEDQETAVEALRRRFPGVSVEEDLPGLAVTVAECARFVDHPDFKFMKRTGP